MLEGEKIVENASEAKTGPNRTQRLAGILRGLFGIGWRVGAAALAAEGTYSVYQDLQSVRDVNEQRIFRAVENAGIGNGVGLEQSQPQAVDPTLCRVLYRETTVRSDDKDVFRFKLGDETITFDRRWVAPPGMIRRGGEISICGKIGEPGKEVIVFIDTGEDDVDWDKRDSLQTFGQPDEPLAKFNTKDWNERQRDEHSVRLVVVRNPETFFDPYYYESTLGDSYAIDLRDLIPEINYRTGESIVSFSSVSKVGNKLWTVAHTQGRNFNILIELTFGADGLPIIETKYVLEDSVFESAAHYVRKSFGAEGSLDLEITPQSLIWPELMSEVGYQELATYHISATAENNFALSDAMKTQDGYFDTNEKSLFLDGAYAMTRVLPIAEDGANVPKGETRFLGEIVEGDVIDAFLLTNSTPKNVLAFVETTKEVAIVTLDEYGRLNKLVIDSLREYANRTDISFRTSVGSDRKLKIDVLSGDPRRILVSIGTSAIVDPSGVPFTTIGVHFLPLPPELEIIE